MEVFGPGELRSGEGIYVVQEEEEEGKEGVDQTQIADCRLQTTLLGEF
jgi:hypothetical protein